ncbi:MAG: hypothetical protein ACERKN_01420 [Velocimicrobium sp.]
MLQTSNYNLNKPEQTDVINIDDLNGNFDTLDRELKKVADKDIVLGETASTAYRGDRGKIAFDHSQATHARTDATKTAPSGKNGILKINNVDEAVYVHPTSNGYRHVPAGGSTGQILKNNGTAGTGVWENDNYLIKGNDYRPNLLINGDFQVWQRGESFLNKYGGNVADRWRMETGGDGRISVTKGTNGLKYEITTVGTYHNLAQPIDPIDFDKFRDKTITMQVKADNTANIYLIGMYYVIDNKYGFIQPTVLSIKKDIITVILSVPFEGNITFLSWIISFNPEVSSTIIYGVKAEVNDHATPFIPKSYAEELRDCQRYYEVSKTSGGVNGALVFKASTINEYQFINIRFRTRKRVTPTVTIKSNAGTNGRISVWGTGVDSAYSAYVNGASLSDEGFNSIILDTTPITEYYSFHYIADAEI